MRSAIAPGARFPDHKPTGDTRTGRHLSEWQGGAT